MRQLSGSSAFNAGYRDLGAATRMIVDFLESRGLLSRDENGYPVLAGEPKDPAVIALGSALKSLNLAGAELRLALNDLPLPEDD